MTPDDELRALLEKIAATAGDPPEHGLDGVVARRRRRTRHRRGAVATAVALAVLGAASLPRVGLLGDDDHDVTAAEGRAEPRRAELPSTLDVRCTPVGIDIPVASIQPQHDGMHLSIDNSLGEATEVWVTSDDGNWDSGRAIVHPGRTDLLQTVAPGALTVGCRTGMGDEQRSVQLVDVDSIYREPELDCPEDEQETVTDPRPVHPSVWSPGAATAGAFVGLWANGDRVQPMSGYRTDRYDSPTTDPATQIVRDGKPIAFVYLVGQSEHDRSVEGPFTAVRRIEACAKFLADYPSTGSAEPTSTP